MRHNSFTNSLWVSSYTLYTVRVRVRVRARGLVSHHYLLAHVGPGSRPPSVAKQAPPPPPLLLLLMDSPILDLDQVRVRLDRRLDWPVQTSSDHSGRQRSLPFEFILYRERVLILKALLLSAPLPNIRVRIVAVAANIMSTVHSIFSHLGHSMSRRRRRSTAGQLQARRTNFTRFRSVHKPYRSSIKSVKFEWAKFNMQIYQI